MPCLLNFHLKPHHKKLVNDGDCPDREGDEHDGDGERSPDNVAVREEGGGGEDVRHHVDEGEHDLRGRVDDPRRRWHFPEKNHV